MQETAALRIPYRGTDNRGVLMESDESLLRRILEAEAKGYRVEIHAIGKSPELIEILIC